TKLNTLCACLPRNVCRTTSASGIHRAVDLRWGLQGPSGGDHREAELALKEMETCERTSLGPTFIALLGSQYGERPLPRLLPEPLFEVLEAGLTPDDLQLLGQWFLRDTNAVPPTYVLQPIRSHLPSYGGPGAEREASSASWRSTEARLQTALRRAASEAQVKGQLTAEQAHRFYQSAPEAEMTAGLLGSGAQSQGDAPRPAAREGPKRGLARLLAAAAAAEGGLDPEARALLLDLKARLSAAGPRGPPALHRHSLELSGGTVDPRRRDHAAYLEVLCGQLVAHMKGRITRLLEEQGAPGGRGSWGRPPGGERSRLLEEVSRHALEGLRRSQELCGREGLLGRLSLALWEASAGPHGPLVLHGAPGAGKTTLLCRLARELLGVLGPGAVVALRFLAPGRGARPDVGALLHSLALQVSLALDLPPPGPPGPQADRLRSFQALLAAASRRGESLVLILDGVDLLSAEDLHWLPAAVPANVHLLLSAASAAPVLGALRDRLGAGALVPVDGLTLEEGREVVRRALSSARRTLTEEQREVVLSSFQKTGSPLHLRLILWEALRWTSYTPPATLRLGADLPDMMALILLSLEDRHGRQLVASALGYIALSRCGLLEAELCDLLSLDDEVLSEVYRPAPPERPSPLRLPPLLWAGLRLDLGPLLLEGWAQGLVLLDFRYQQLCEAVRERYLGDQRRNRMLSEYFLGLWSGKLKPLALPPRTLLLSDRKVPPQPLWFAPGLANMRKLQELPYQLLHAGLWEELQQEVIGMTHPSCTSRLCGIDSVIEDLRMCADLMSCTQSALVLIGAVRPLPDRALFFSELVGRLLSLGAAFPSLIGRLVGQCEAWLLSCEEPVLVPKSSFLAAPGGPLRHSFTGGRTGGRSTAGLSLYRRSLSLPPVSLSTAGCVWGSGTDCLSLAADGSLRRWSLLSGKQVYCVQSAMDPDSATASLHLSQQTDQIFIYTKTQVDKPVVVCLELAHNKKLLFCGLKTGTVLIYPLDRPQETLCLPPPESLPRVQALALDPGERQLAAAYEGSLALFEVTTRDGAPSVEGPVRTLILDLLQAPVSCAALLADGRLLYGTAGGELSLWASGAPRGPAPQGPYPRGPAPLEAAPGPAPLEAEAADVRVLCAAFSESDQLVFTGSLDRTIKVWDVATGTILTRYIMLRLLHHGTTATSCNDCYIMIPTGYIKLPKHNIKLRPTDMLSAHVLMLEADCSLTPPSPPPGRLLFLQRVDHAPVSMLTYRNGFVALGQRGAVLREVFRCPAMLGPDHAPLRSVRARCRLTSREKAPPPRRQTPALDFDYNPAQLNFNLLGMGHPSSTTCVVT
uniref:NACHT and WD repeat domain containing 1 n=1 Tax=Gadus morhua TaxID=8049 RepID=A0A8C5C5I3_GADMO